MIGVPCQTYQDIAGDILFLRDMEIDMMGGGPFIEYSGTPFCRGETFSTAMQALDKFGREKGFLFGANVMMPNLTPAKQRKDYLLYEDKPSLDEEPFQCNHCLSVQIASVGDTIGYGQRGTPATSSGGPKHSAEISNLRLDTSINHRIIFGFICNGIKTDLFDYRKQSVRPRRGKMFGQADFFQKTKIGIDNFIGSTSIKYPKYQRE